MSRELLNSLEGFLKNIIAEIANLDPRFYHWTTSNKLIQIETSATGLLERLCHLGDDSVLDRWANEAGMQSDEIDDHTSVWGGAGPDCMFGRFEAA